ncbi:BLUF domain-containing protein [Stenotrophomonas maltophilia]|nr:BLUF domain-containing protein [Stenotrophomonas maltophilia]
MVKSQVISPALDCEMQALVLLSAATQNLSEYALSYVVADAVRSNHAAGVTGVMLFDGGRFLVYMEGPSLGMEVALARTSKATSHSEVVELARGRVHLRRFPQWPMRCFTVSPEALRILVRADWSGFDQRFGKKRILLTGMEHLAEIVERHSQMDSETYGG